MPTYTFLGQTPNDGTYEVGTGPFKDLPAGTYEGNFYGNDPRLGIIQSGQPRYSLPDSSEDASSSGNTFQVGTGPQPGLPAGRFLPEEVKSFFRDQARAAASAAAAARPPPPQVTFAPPAGAAPVTAQTTLPSPVTPVAVPRFVPATGIPNFGGNNLLATGATGATGAAGVIGPTGVPGIPGIVSPLQSLLPSPSTVPATGSNALAVPNLSSSIPASVFSQLFPSIPDISQTPLATVAHGGPILASDSLPGYQDAGDVNAELEARRPEIMTGLREFFVERGRYTDEQFLAEFGRMSTKDLLREFMAQEKAEESFRDSFPSLRGFSSPETSPEPSLDTPLPDDLRSFEMPPPPPPPPPSGLPLGENYYPPPPPPEEKMPEDPLRMYEIPSAREQYIAHGGPILASEYLNAGGPVQYFSNGQGVNDGNQTNSSTTSTTTQMSDEEVNAAFANVPFGMFTNPANYESGPGIGVSGASLGLSEGQVSDLVTGPDINDPSVSIGYSDPVMNALTDRIPIPFTNRTLPFSPLDALTTAIPIAPISAGLALARGAQAVVDFNNNVPVSGVIPSIVETALTSLGVQPGSISITPPDLNDPTDPPNPDPTHALSIPSLIPAEGQ